MKHISAQEWSRSDSRFPKQIQNIPSTIIPDENIGERYFKNCSLTKNGVGISGDCREKCMDSEALRSSYQTKCFVLVVELVSTFFEVSVESLQAQTRCAAPICQARQICMYLLHTSLSISYPDIGRLFRRDRTTISHACMVVEDLRDDTGIDGNLTRLESILMTILSLLGGTGLLEPGEVQ